MNAREDVYVSVGEVVAGKYLVERVLGIGGMAFVVSARHLELDEPFALKFLASGFLRDKAIIERFTREAKAACRIRSEHIARVYDVGSHDGAPYLVMEHLHGRDLATVLAERGALPVEEAVEYVMHACEALAAAHALGIVHRDVKPENLFLVERDELPRVKVLDFGISKIALGADAAEARLTGQLTLGTPWYMSPEQVRCTASADARSDLWALGAVLYELLTGVEAFRADTVNEVCAAVLEVDPVPVDVVRPGLPAELAAVVARCLEKDPAARFEDVAELAAALLPFAPSRALVSAERASSSLEAAARASGRARAFNPLRVTTPTPGRRRTGVDAPPPSGAPVAHTLSRADTARTKGSAGRNFVLGAVAFGVVALVGIGAPGLVRRGADVGASPASLAPPASTAPPEATTLAGVPRLERDEGLTRVAAGDPEAREGRGLPAAARPDVHGLALGTGAGAGARPVPAALPASARGKGTPASVAAPPSPPAPPPAAAAPASAGAEAARSAPPPAAGGAVDLGY